MISLLQPLYLLAFLGLLVPIAIHLWNKKEGKVLKIGTVRWMQKKASSRVSKIKFNNRLLFILRCAIISLVVLVLAQLFIKKSTGDVELKWALIDPQVDFSADNIRQMMDTLESDGFEVLALDYGFKNILPDEIHSTKVNLNNTWSVLKTVELLENQPDSILVITKGYVKNFSGTKPEFNIPLAWMIIPDQDPALFIYDARLLNGDSLMVKIGKSESSYTQITDFVTDLQNPILSRLHEIDPTVSLKVRGDSLKLQKDNETLTARAIDTIDSLQVLILYGEELQKDLVYWKAGLSALSQHQKIPLAVEVTNTDKDEEGVSLSKRVYDWLVVLKEDGFYNEEISAQKVFVTSVSKDSLDINWFTLKEKKDGEIYSINNSITNDKGILQSFPTALLEIFHSDYDSSLWLNDKRTIPFEQLDLSIRDDAIDDESEQKVSYQKADSIFWIATLILLLLERLISYKRELS